MKPRLASAHGHSALKLAAGDQVIPLKDLPASIREDIEDAPFWKEVVAFTHIPRSELDPHYGEYVAVYKGNIVDSDTDEAVLAERFFHAFGYVPVYIHKVGVEDDVVDLDYALSD